MHPIYRRIMTQRVIDEAEVLAAMFYDDEVEIIEFLSIITVTPKGCDVPFSLTFTLPLGNQSITPLSLLILNNWDK